MKPRAPIILAAALASSAGAHAQLTVSWSTLDGGGGVSSGGSYTIAGTVAQPDAAAMAAGTLSLRAGFWAAFGGGGCYSNCDESAVPPVLNVADFTCFLQRFAAGNSYANCDQSTIPPVLNVADFTCFLQRFAAGCP